MKSDKNVDKANSKTFQLNFINIVFIAAPEFFVQAICMNGCRFYC